VTGALCSPPRIIVVPTVVSFCELRHARGGEAVVGALHGPRERANPKSCVGWSGACGPASPTRAGAYQEIQRSRRLDGHARWLGTTAPDGSGKGT